MIYLEKHMNLFTVDKKYSFVHCIAEDARMGAGIAVDFTKHFPEIKKLRKEILHSGSCVKVGRVLNLITKRVSSGKPSYESLTAALMNCMIMCLEEDINFLAMPKIGCGLDRLQWPKVREIIKIVFQGTGIEILVCVL